MCNKPPQKRDELKKHTILKKRAAFAGSFDPPTFGHIDIIKRAAALFDELIVVSAEDDEKNYLFSAEERRALLESVVKDFKNVSVDVCPSGTLLVDFLHKKNIPVIVRAFRNGIDFEKERALEAVNKTIRPDIETVFLFCKNELSFVSSSAVSTLVLYDTDISSFVPCVIEDAVRKKIKKIKEKK